MYRPDSVDGFLEGRSILSYLSADTYVQWLAYGAMYPLAAQDFLLVTSQEPFDKKKDKNKGFIIASTSVDDLCEIGADNESYELASTVTPDGVAAAQFNNNPASHFSTEASTPKKKYHRSALRLAGYVGVALADGSTQLTFMIDLPLLRLSSAAWMLRFLAQYSMTELASRVRHALSPFNNVGAERALMQSIAPLPMQAQHNANMSPIAEESQQQPVGGNATATAAASSSTSNIFGLNLNLGGSNTNTLELPVAAAVSNATSITATAAATSSLSSTGLLLGGGGTRTADLQRMLAHIQQRELSVLRRSSSIERVPVEQSRRDRTNSVEYFSQSEQLQHQQQVGFRSRLDSDRSVGAAATWHDVRSRSNSVAAASYADDADRDSLGRDSYGGGVGRASDIYNGGSNNRIPPHSPGAMRHTISAMPNNNSSRIGGGGGGHLTPNNATKPPRQAEKSLSTFSLLKRTLSRTRKTPKSLPTSTSAGSSNSGLYLSHIDDEDSDHYNKQQLNTPEGSPRRSAGGKMLFSLQQPSATGSPDRVHASYSYIDEGWSQYDTNIPGGGSSGGGSESPSIGMYAKKSMYSPRTAGIRGLGSSGNRRSKGEEVDYDAVSKELSKISPSKSSMGGSGHLPPQRRRSSSQQEYVNTNTQPAHNSSTFRSNNNTGTFGRPEMTYSSTSDASDHSTQRGARLPPPMPMPPGVHRSQSTSDAQHAASAGDAQQHRQQHPQATHISQSMNDISSLAATAASALDLPAAAWRVYHNYFDESKGRSELGLDWQLKFNKPNINIFSSAVAGSSWCAIKAVTVMRVASPMALVDVLLNYDRMGEYDSMFKNSKVRILYLFNGILSNVQLCG